MTDRPQQLVRLFGLVPALLVAALSLYRVPAFTKLELDVYDNLARSVPPRPPSGRVVIVDVDERSLSTVGQWPWRRDIVGNLVSRLRDLGASAVALDVIFAEPDRYSGSGGAGDTALANTLRAGRIVLGYAFTFGEANTGSGNCVQHPLALPVLRRGDERTDDPVFRATGAICSLETLTRAAGSSGFLNAAPDADGLLRRVPLLIELDGRIYPALALAAVATVTGTRAFGLRVVNVNTSSLMLDGVNVPLDGKSNLLLRYRGPKRTFPYISAEDVLSGAAGSSSFKDKVVFVGTTALGTREVVATPLDTLFAGVEVQATVADNLLQHDFIQRPDYGITAEMQATLVLGIVLVVLFTRFGFLWTAVAAAAGLTALWVGALTLMSSKGIFLSPLYPTIGAVTTLAVAAVVQFALEQRRAEGAIRDRSASQRLLIQSLLSLTEVRDAETGRHSRRTQLYTRILAEQLAKHPKFSDYLTPQTINLMSTLAPLHDIGKVGVPDRLLNKPGPLTANEFQEMQRHPAYGRDVIVKAQRGAEARDDGILAMAKEIVYTHHERWDGTGYPEGLRERQIPIAGRLIALVDVFDALLTRRLYRQPMSFDEVVTFILKGKGSHFDPDVIDAFMQVSEALREASANTSD